MDENRKRAYRLMLYLAMLYIRPIQHYLDFDLTWFTGFSWRKRKRYIRIQGAVANWLHNLAQFSALDFNGFDEDEFWQDYDRLKRAHPCLPDYRDRFESWLAEDFRRLYP